MNSIAVWGSPGSGKSLISVAIAHEISRRYKKSVIVISDDNVAPMLSVFAPLEELGEKNSIGVLNKLGITQDNFKNKIIVHNKNNNVGFMGYISGDTPVKYQNFSGKEIQNINYFLRSDRTFGDTICDIVVFDCRSDILNSEASYDALSSSDKVLRIISPEPKSLSFFEGYLPLIDGDLFKADEHIRLLNNCFEYSPYKQMKKDYDFDFIIPHTREMYTNFLEGGIFKLNGYEKHTLRSLCERIMES